MSLVYLQTLHPLLVRRLWLQCLWYCVSSRGDIIRFLSQGSGWQKKWHIVLPMIDVADSDQVANPLSPDSPGLSVIPSIIWSGYYWQVPTNRCEEVWLECNMYRGVGYFLGFFEFFYDGSYGLSPPFISYMGICLELFFYLWLFVLIWFLIMIFRLFCDISDIFRCIDS